MKFKKILAAVAAAAVAVSTMAVSAFAADVWTGSNDLGTSWDGSKVVTIDGSQFADTQDGDTVEISYTTGDAEYFQLKISENANNWAVLESPTGVDPQWGTVTVEKDTTSYSFNINAADIAKVQATGMVISGYGVTVTNVAVNGGTAAPAAEAETTEAAEAVAVDYTAAIYFADTSWAHQDDKTAPVKVTGNGQYVVESTAAAGATDLGVFVVDIANFNAEHPEAKVVLDKIEIDGAELTFDADKVVYGDIEENGNYRIEIYNQYGDTKDNPPVDASTAVNSTIKVTFTVSDIAAAAAPADETATAAAPEETEAAPEAEEEEAVDVDDEDVDVDVEEEPEEEAAPVETEAAPVEEAPAAETATAAPATGNTAVATVVAVMAVAGAAAIVAKKRK